MIDKLVVYPENMQRNLDRLGGLVHSQRVLIALTQKGVAREDAYRLVQRNAMRGVAGQGRLPRAAEGRPRGREGAHAPAELEALFDLGYHPKHVDTIFARVFGRRDARHRHPASAAERASNARGAWLSRTRSRVAGDDAQTMMRARMTTMIAPMAAMTICSSHSLPRFELPAGRVEDEAADEGADEAGDQIAQQAAAAADHELASQPATMPTMAQMMSC